MRELGGTREGRAGSGSGKEPVGFIRVVASLVPRQREEVVNPLAELTDDELDKLDAILASIREDEAPAPH
jgi:hypothetical protein